MSPRGDEPGDEGFLTRWSRRKVEIAREDAKPARQADSPLPPASAMSDVSDMAHALPKSETSDFGGEGLGMGGRSESGSPSRRGRDGLDSPPHPGPPHRKRGEGEEAPEPEMVEPPSLDLVDKDFDVAHWLKQNVPESWKLAALRRAWESDPAIAGFENPARDYALDWNTPGGAPGYGPLTESDDVAAMVRGIFGDTPPPETEPAIVAEATGDSMPHRLSSKYDGRDDDAAVRDVDAEEQLQASVRLTGDAAEAPDHGEIAPNSTARLYAAVQNRAAPRPTSMRVRKRGGGAVPD